MSPRGKPGNKRPWLWAEKGALRLIREACEAEGQPVGATIGVYLALCELASDYQKDVFTAGLTRIGALAGMTKRNAKRVVPMLEKLNLISVEPQKLPGTNAAGWSKYTLLSCPHVGTVCPQGGDDMSPRGDRDEKINVPAVEESSEQSSEESASEESSVEKSPPQDLRSEDAEAFDHFYNLFPKKQKRSEALEEWRLQNLDNKASEIMVGLESWTRSEEWRKQAGRFIPSAVNFLKDQRWEQTPRGSGQYKEDIPMPIWNPMD